MTIFSQTSMKSANLLRIRWKYKFKIMKVLIFILMGSLLQFPILGSGHYLRQGVGRCKFENRVNSKFAPTWNAHAMFLPPLGSSALNFCLSKFTWSHGSKVCITHHAKMTCHIRYIGKSSGIAFKENRGFINHTLHCIVSVIAKPTEHLFSTCALQDHILKAE